MKEKSITRKVVLIFILFILSFSLVPSCPCSTDAQSSEQQNTQAAGVSDNAVQPIIRRPDRIDKDSDRIQDRLETMISEMISNKSAVLPVVVTLYEPVLDEDLNSFRMLGGRVTQVYRYVTYGFAGVISAVNVSAFAGLKQENLCVIEYDAPLQFHLDVSVPLIRARPLVWETYGYTGSSNYSIAIIDTGIDDSHPDVGPYEDLNFSRKMVGWYDATIDGSSTPQDYGEHGTHVAGIAAGTGTANSLQGHGTIETTFTYTLPPTGYGYIDCIDVMDQGIIDLNCGWDGGNNVLLRLYNPAGGIVAQKSGSSSPLLLSYNTAGTAYPTGRFRVLVGNLAGPSGTPFSCIEAYPYQGLNDGYGLFTGVAPGSKLVGVKVFDNGGSGTLSTLIGGMDWVVENRVPYHIVVASMSVGLEDGGVDSTLDQKADTMVQNGIVTVVSAGNDFPSYSIGSPGTAAYVITVAATNDQDGITDYSSNGDTSRNEYGLIKPDVAAPGGTFDPQFGNQILSVDSSDLDAGYTGYEDRNADDYQHMAGTSMSVPHVSGLAALLIQASGGWNWTQSEALRVKMIMSMTSFETQNGEAPNLPPLNRGDKDNKEGYGRICADAAIEAATMTYEVGELGEGTLGLEPSDKKVWARQVYLSARNAYTLNLSVPSGADYDLYLYSNDPDSYGQPVILEKSIDASSGADERIQYVPQSSDTYYVVVKWVSGAGTFSLQSTSAPVRDLAVLSVAPSLPQVYEGRAVNITVTVRNMGGLTETFNVTTYYDDNLIGTQTVTDLGVDAIKTLTFTWNTSGVTLYINYTLKAEADVLLGEINTDDNTYVDGGILLKMLGDVDGDGIIDIVDLATVGRAFGTRPGDPLWNPQADLREDNVIDIDDLIIVARNYGKTY